MRASVLACVAVLLTASPAVAAERHGFVTFPTDEHQHVDGWDYWWGAADLVTRAGRRYTLGYAYTIFDGGASIQSSYQLFPRQGPYRGRAVVTMDGPTEWGHPAQPAGRIQHYASYPVPGVDSLLALDTYDSSANLALVDRWERTSLSGPTYRLLVDQDEAGARPLRPRRHPRARRPRGAHEPERAALPAARRPGRGGHEPRRQADPL